jgi:hypothetical protein
MNVGSSPLVGYGVYLGLLPADSDGPIALKFEAAVTAAAGYDLNLFSEAAADQIPFIQTVYINNDGAGDTTLTCKVTGHTIKVKANTQGWYPLLVTDVPQFSIAVSADRTVKMQFVNIPISAAQWATA